MTSESPEYKAVQKTMGATIEALDCTTGAATQLAISFSENGWHGITVYHVFQPYLVIYMYNITISEKHIAQ